MKIRVSWHPATKPFLQNFDSSFCLTKRLTSDSRLNVNKAWQLIGLGNLDVIDSTKSSNILSDFAFSIYNSTVSLKHLVSL